MSKDETEANKVSSSDSDSVESVILPFVNTPIPKEDEWVVYRITSKGKQVVAGSFRGVDKIGSGVCTRVFQFGRDTYGSRFRFGFTAPVVSRKQVEMRFYQDGVVVTNKGRNKITHQKEDSNILRFIETGQSFTWYPNEKISFTSKGNPKLILKYNSTNQQKLSKLKLPDYKPKSKESLTNHEVSRLDELKQMEERNEQQEKEYQAYLIAFKNGREQVLARATGGVVDSVKEGEDSGKEQEEDNNSLNGSVKKRKRRSSSTTTTPNTSTLEAEMGMDSNKKSKSINDKEQTSNNSEHEHDHDDVDGKNNNNDKVKVTKEENSVVKNDDNELVKQQHDDQLNHEKIFPDYEENHHNGNEEGGLKVEKIDNNLINKRMLRRNSSSNWMLSGPTGSPRFLTSPRLLNRGDGSPSSPNSQRLWSANGTSRFHKGFNWIGAEPSDENEETTDMTSNHGNDLKAHIDDEDVLGEDHHSDAGSSAILSSRCHSPVFQTTQNMNGNGPQIRTAEGFPFLKRQASNASILSSDKHGSPRHLNKQRIRGNSMDGEEILHNNNSVVEQNSIKIKDESNIKKENGDNEEEEEELEEQKLRRSERGKKKDKDEESESEIIRPPGWVGPRVGSEFQVEIPDLLVKPKSLDAIIGNGKGSIGAWQKALQNEPEPLPENADEKEDTTKNWSNEEKLAFDKAMYDYVKDFVAIARGVPIFQHHNKTPNDLISYFYKQYKNSPQYEKWKQTVSESGGSTTPTNNKSNDSLIEQQQQQQHPTAAFETGSSSSTRTYTGKPPSALQVMKDLITLGILQPGKSCIVMNYQGQLFKMDLLETGQVCHEGSTYDSISSLTTRLKKQINPAVRADNGWTSLYYKGRSLGEYKNDFWRPTSSATPNAQKRRSSLLGKDSNESSNNNNDVQNNSNNNVDDGSGGKQPNNKKLKRTLSICSTSLPRDFAHNSISSVANISNNGAMVSTKPWTLVNDLPSAINTGVSRAARGGRFTRGGNNNQSVVVTQTTRQNGFFDLHFDSESDENNSDSDTDIMNGNDNSGSNSNTIASKKAVNKNNVTLKHLIDKNLILPGKRVLRIIYKEKIFYGDLLPNGRIVDSQTGMEYTQPSFWSVEVKRSLTPTLRSDSPWYSIYYIGFGENKTTDIDSSSTTHQQQQQQQQNNEKDESSSNNEKEENVDNNDGDANDVDDEENDDEEEDQGDDDSQDEDEDEYLNLHAYRKQYLDLKEARRVEKMNEKFSIVEQLRRMRNGNLRSVLAVENHKYDFEEKIISTKKQKEDTNDEKLLQDTTSKSKKKKSSNNKVSSKRKFCICQTGEEDHPQFKDDKNNWFLHCSKGSGICGGWIHPKCFGFNELTQPEAEQLREFVCPLCSADGIRLIINHKQKLITNKSVVYKPGTILMCRIDLPHNNPIGWFSAKITQVDFVNHPSAPYKIVYAFDPQLTEWVTLGPNDPTKVLAADWSRSSCYSKQDALWRTSNKKC